MKTFSVTEPDMGVFVSDDLSFSGGFDMNELALSSVLETFHSLNDATKQYIELYCKKASLRIGALVARGRGVSGTWVYRDGQRKSLVQSWVSEYEKTYGLLIVHTCNPAALTVYSRSALLLIPDDYVSHYGGNVDSVCRWSLLHPTKGDLSHVIEYELRLLVQRGGI